MNDRATFYGPTLGEELLRVGTQQAPALTPGQVRRHNGLSMEGYRAQPESIFVSAAPSRPKTKRDLFVAALHRGVPFEDALREAGIKRCYGNSIIAEHAPMFRKKPVAHRWLDVVAFAALGFTYRQIAPLFGVTAESIRAIVKDHLPRRQTSCDKPEPSVP